MIHFFSLFFLAIVFNHTNATPQNSLSQFWLLKPSAFSHLVNEDKTKYINLAFAVLDEAEKSNVMKNNCILGGRVFPKNKTTCMYKSKICLAREIECAPYLAQNNCVSSSHKISSTAQCFQETADKTKLVRFLSNNFSFDIWLNISNAVTEYCQIKKDSKSCQDLLTTTNTYKATDLKQLPKNTMQYLKGLNKLNIFFVLFSGLLNNGAHAEDSKYCSYDKKTQIFYGQKGQKIQLHFAAHSDPNSVQEFCDDIFEAGDDKKLKLYTARKFIDKNKNENENMVAYSNQIYDKLKSGELNWVGLELPQEFLDEGGGASAFCERSENNRQKFLLMGLSEEETIKAMVNLDGSGGFAYCRWINSLPAESQTKLPTEMTRAKALEKVSLIGLDNSRIKNVEKLEIERQSSINQSKLAFDNLLSNNKTEADRVFLKKISDKWIVSNNLSDLIDLSISPEYEKLSPSCKKSFDDFLQSEKNSYNAHSKFQNQFNKETQLRDYGMASDSIKSIEKGNGLAVIGSWHEPGMTKYMEQMCRKGILNTPSQMPDDNTTQSKSAN